MRSRWVVLTWQGNFIQVQKHFKEHAANVFDRLLNTTDETENVNGQCKKYE